MEEEVDSLSEAYDRIIQTEMEKFLEIQDISFDRDKFELIDKNFGGGLTKDTEIYYGGELVITLEQKAKKDGSFEFESLRHYTEEENGDG